MRDDKGNYLFKLLKKNEKEPDVSKLRRKFITKIRFRSYLAQIVVAILFVLWIISIIRK